MPKRKQLAQVHKSMKTDGSSHLQDCVGDLCHLTLGQGLILALGCCNGPDHHAEHGLGGDIRDRITNLLSTGCKCTTQSNHLDDVDTWVSAPGDCSQIAGLRNKSPGGLRLLLSCRREADHQSH